MCCLFSTLVMLGPRAAILVWWLLEPVRWNAAFDTFIVPLFGFMFFPFTTLMYVAVAPAGVNGFDWVWVGLAVALDVMSWAGGGYSGRNRVQGAAA